MNDHTEDKIPPQSRGSVRWFLFLVFFHLVPVPWFLFVVAGLAPASFLFVGGLASLYLPGSDSLGFAFMLLGPALVAGLVFYLIAYLISIFILRITRPWVRTSILFSLLAICLISAMNPIFVYGGHSRSSSYSLFDFIQVLGEFRIPASASIAYFVFLSVLLIGLLGYQNLVALKPPLSLERWLLIRRIQRWVLVGSLATLLVFFCWTHRIILVVKPLAKFGIASAQYRLALAIKEHSRMQFRSDVGYHEWLVRAADQGHSKAAFMLVKHPRSPEEKQRWLLVAAGGGHAEAQYLYYQFIIKSDLDLGMPQTALNWLEKAAENDYSDAQYELGKLYINGQTRLEIKKDLAKSRHWWERAAKQKHGRAVDELAWRYAKGADGFPRDPQHAIMLFNQATENYLHGLNGRPQNKQMADSKQRQAEKMAQFEDQLALGNPQTQAELGRELLGIKDALPDTRAEGLDLLEKAANQGDPELQYEIGGIFLFGRLGHEIDLPRGRAWWEKSLVQHHIKTMEYVAPAYQDGRFGYPIDLLKSKAWVERLVEAYRDGPYGADPDPNRERYWKNELKYFDRLIELAGGAYSSPDELKQKAEAEDSQAQYQLGRQLMVSGPPAHRKQGLDWIERSAESGYAEAQYRLVTYFERQRGIMRSNPTRGVAMLQAAAEQNHLPAMGTLALGFAKGRYGLNRDHNKAKIWYERLLDAYESGNYIGEIDERFIPFQRAQLNYADKALKIERDKARRYKEASPLERQIIKIEEHYRERYQKAVNALDRRDGSPTGQKRIRAEIGHLRDKYAALREEEITRIKEQWKE
ncbi:MAG: hypothetical protein QNK25_02760 [Desulfobacterales bacterium]|nr:hypothetical protein [Desulfobacterales bacterium]